MVHIRAIRNQGHQDAALLQHYPHVCSLLLGEAVDEADTRQFGDFITDHVLSRSMLDSFLYLPQFRMLPALHHFKQHKRQQQMSIILFHQSDPGIQFAQIAIRVYHL